MGTQDGGGLARRARQLAPLAALAGAAAAGAAAAWRQRRRTAPVDPDASLAGPPTARPRVAPTADRREVTDGHPSPAPPARTPAAPASPVAALVAALAPALEPSADADLALAAPPEPTAGRPPLTHRGPDDATPAAGAEVGVEIDAAAADSVTEVAAVAPRADAHSGNGAGGPPDDAGPPPAAGSTPATGPALDPAPTAMSSPPSDPVPTRPTAPPAPPAPPRAAAPWRVERRFEPAASAPLLPDDPAADDDAPAAPMPTSPAASAVPADATRAAPAPAPAPAYATPSAPTPRASAPPDAITSSAAAPPDEPERRPGVLSRQIAGLRRHRVRLVAGLVVVGLGVGASALLAGVGGDEPVSGPSSTAPPTTAAPATTTTTRPALTPDEAFALVAERLSTAGTFGYRGMARATDVSFVRPMMWLSVESSVTGEVELATGRLHEVAVAADGRASETVTEGPVVWGRRASRAATLDDEPYALVPELSDPELLPARGLVMLPTWLAAATEPVELEPAPDGLARFQATVPSDVVGEVERGIEAEDVLAVVTVDDDGAPVRVELTSASSDRLRLVLELTGIGEPVAIAPPPTPPPA